MPKFKVIYTDPPWPYNTKSESCIAQKKVFSGSASNKMYSITDMVGLSEMNVPSIVNDDAVMFMWVLSGYLERAIVLMDAWGFRCVTVAFVWVKVHESNGNLRTNLAPITLPSTELCLYGSRGQPVKAGILNQFTGVKQVQEHPVIAHSKKPQLFRDLIARRLTSVRASERLEMFARGKVRGWRVFGNEAEGSIKMPMRECPW